MSVSHDLSPTTLPPGEFSADDAELLAALEVLDQDEATAIAAVLKTDTVLTEVTVRGNRFLDESERSAKFDRAADFLGFASEGEVLQTDLLTLAEMRSRLISGDVADTFNNEFTHFVYSFEIGENLHYGNLHGTMPAAMRFRAAYPDLAQNLQEYGDGKSMREFYGGLVEDTPESRRMFVFFTIADNLMQRLVRPNDYVYQRKIVEDLIGQPADTRFPRYDDVRIGEDDEVFTDTRTPMWR